ncbi:uncharacterized protein LOC120348185 [Styela clava]|uniref:sporulation-specific protein 15-like n=1 Tax=Styela clava TaxID=7725 RepID=UPI00193A1DD8|nr:sporulation-specific protein 15-like [Styela clava]
MLKNLKTENLKLREKLKLLRQETDRSLDETVIGALTSSPTSERLKFILEDQDTDIAGTMLSDKAKVVRGEASKRIGVLLQDWREFKETSENELRRRLRTEQNLKELIARKDREMEELSYEISSYRSLALEQKNTIEILLEEKEIGEKCKVKCAELERLLAKERRYNGEVSAELRSRDDILRQSAAEKEALLALNNELRSANIAQKKRLEMCERDVTETSRELEMLEDMVKALQDRKSFLEPHAPSPSSKILGLSNVSASMHRSSPNGSSTSKTISFRPQLNSTLKDVSDSSPARNRIIPISLQDGNSQLRPTDRPSTSSTGSSANGRSTDGSKNTDDSFTSKKSAMSALESLQKDHNKKCNFLAEHIKKLKEENKEKESRLRQLENQPPT